MAQPSRTVGPYRLDAVLGRGGMGEVYKAYDERLDRHVAVKRIRLDADEHGTRRRRFRREARMAAQLVHPGIVQVFDIHETGDSDWIIMELVQGRTMADMLDHGPMDVDAVLGYAVEIADALAAAHERGVVHRDLKAENVMITRQGHAKLLDFGIAKQLWATNSSADDMESSLTAQGHVVGTVRAMSPEQARGFAIDHRSDLFSLGTLLYEALAGVSPFVGATRLDTLTRVSTHRHTPVAELATLDKEIPDRLSKLIDRLLEKAPELRPASAEEVRAELQAIADARRAVAMTGAETTRAATQDATADMTGDATADMTGDAMARQPAIVSGVSEVSGASGGVGAARQTRGRVAIVAALALGALVAALGVALSWRASTPERDSAAAATPGASRSEDARPSASDSYEHGMELLRRFHVAGNVDRAVAVFQRMLAESGDSAAAHAGLARAYWTRYWNADESRDPMYLDQARDIAERAVALDEFLAEARISRALVYWQLGRLDDAAREFATAIDLEPDNPEAHYGAARVYQAQNRFADAEAAYDRAIELSPGDRRLHDDLGSLYFALGRLDDAEQAFARSIAAAPDSIHGYRNLGSVYLVQGRHGDAATQFQAALKIRPSASLYSNLGTVLFAQGLYSRAAAAFESALAMDGAANYHLYWANLADAYRHTPDDRNKANDHYLRAIQLVDAALARSPDDATLRSQRVLYLAKRGQCDDARAAMLAMAATQVAYVSYRIAVALELCGDRSGALTVLRHALSSGLSLAEVKNDPELAALRSDPDYHRMLMAGQPQE